jgi:hypothetical protein
VRAATRRQDPQRLGPRHPGRRNLVVHRKKREAPRSFDGLGGKTLKNIGNELGLTRERIRQIVTPIAKEFNMRRPDLPILDRAIEFVDKRMPAFAENIEAELCTEGLISQLFRLEGLIKAAELLGRRPPFSITKVKGERIVHQATIRSIDLPVCAARRVIASRGIATLAEVAAEVRELEPGRWDVELLEML